MLNLPNDRTLVMGILNVTPDSFSDGGDFIEPATAIEHGLAMLAEGADIIDVGGESTRPGATRPATGEELGRVLPVIDALARAGAVLSIDTMRADVARAAVGAGVQLVNDVSGGLADPEMLATVADLGVPYVAMHWRGQSATMQDRAIYTDVVAEVRAELADRIDAALLAGIDRSLLVVDPGLGFAKSPSHNWSILARLDELQSLGLPLLVGASRKRFLGELLPGEDGVPRPPRQRDDASVAITALLAGRGVWGVRTHSVRPHRDAIAVAGGLRA